LKVHLPESPEIPEQEAWVREQQNQEEEEEERKQEEEAKTEPSPEMNLQPALTLLKI